jgi:hypothetical protein
VTKEHLRLGAEARQSAEGKQFGSTPWNKEKILGINLLDNIRTRY